MREALRAYLLGDAGVAALVAGRVSWATRPRRGALPSIVLTRISGLRHYAMTNPSRLVTSRVQVDCWALSNLEAGNVARAVNAALGGLRATITPPGTPPKPVEIQGAFLESETDLTDDGAPPDEILQRVSLDFLIWHDE